MSKTLIIRVRLGFLLGRRKPPVFCLRTLAIAPRSNHCLAADGNDNETALIYTRARIKLVRAWG